MNKKSIQLNVAQILRQLGGEIHIERANTLESGLTAKDSLNLRSLDLKISNIEQIFNCLSDKDHEVGTKLRSISLSYNKLLGNSGAITVIRNLPLSVRELGLVNCEIGDEGGKEILEWIEGSSDLTMVCIEGNNFSKELRMKFENLNSVRSQLMLVY